MNQSDVESLAGDVARSTPLPQVTLIAPYHIWCYCDEYVAKKGKRFAYCLLT